MDCQSTNREASNTNHKQGRRERIRALSNLTSRRRSAIRKLERFEPRVLLSGTITGLVFEDYNANGVYDNGSTMTNASAGSIGLAIDRGLSGVVVTAYDNAGTVRGTATSGSNGTYSLNATGTGPYRLQFTSLPSGAFDGTIGTGSKGTVQFVADGNSSNNNLGVSIPGDYSQNNPVIALTQYIYGDNINGSYANLGAILGFNESAGATYGTTSGDYAQPTSLAFSIPAKLVGTTFGLAANPVTGMLYASSYTKRFAGYGPNAAGTGTTDGAIYAINPSTGTVSVLADLNTIFGANTAGVDFRTQSGWSGYDSDGGNNGWDAVGKTSLGGMAISPDGKTLYVMNLANRTLYSVPTTGAVNSSTIKRVSIPFNSPGATGTSGGTQAGDLRPFAVSFANGKLYIGIVNSAQSTQSAADLKAYVYTADPSTLAFSSSPVFQMNLNYTRGYSAEFTGTGNPSADWNPWVTTFMTLGSGSTSSYAQPMLSSIAFNANGDMVLGLRDRGGDESGFFTYANPAKSTTTYEGISAGDTLMAFINTPGDFSSGWTLENNARGPSGQGQGTQNTGTGPGNGSFFYQQNYTNFHSNVSEGGILQIPGFPDVIASAFDPGTTTVRTGGVRWYNETTGATDKAYQTYNTGFNQPPQATFGKAQGNGALALITTAAPIEIGNRVFKDLNDNGIQDPNDPGIAGVTLHLYQGNTLVGTTTTDSTGQYLFNASNVPGGLLPNTAYQVRFDNATDFGSNGPLNALLPTIYGADPSGVAGSKATLSGTTPVINVTTGSYGANDHTLDAGFVPTAAVSGTVYNDANNNGVYNGGESPISGVTITLTGTDDQGNAVNLTTTTANDGTYNFSGLRPSNATGYTITETLPNGYLVGKNSTGANSLTVSGIVAAPGSSTAGVNFGNLLPSSLAGYVYVDSNNDGTKQSSETGVTGATVTLTGTDDLGNTVNQTATTLGDGSYRFSNLRPSNASGYRLMETQPSGYLDGKDTIGTPGGTTANDQFSAIVLPSGTNGISNNFGELLAASLSGFVYVDANNDGTKQAGESGISGVSIVLTGTNDLGQAVNLSTTTASNGSYSFTNLRPSNATGYTIVETQPSGYLDGKDTIGTPGGTTANDQFSAIVLTSGTSGTNNNFGEVLAASLAGVVYVDTNNDGAKQSGEAGIAGVTVTLTGTNDLGQAVNTSTTTNGSGAYSFTGLRPSNGSGYILTETQPSGYLDGKDTIGTPGGTTANDQFSAIVLTSGTNGANNNFGELLAASLSGFVYLDTNNDGTKQGSESGISGVTITLTGTNDLNASVNLTATTNSSGAYSFNNLRPGVYNVNETQPSAYVDGKDTAGNGGGTVGNDQISSIAISAGTSDINYNFGELGAAISGTVYLDANQNATLDSGENGRAGVTVTLLDSSNNVIGSTTTASDGTYSFANLPAGNYSVMTTVPTGYGSTTPTTTAVNLPTAGKTGVNFGIATGSIAGLVFTDVNTNGTYEPGTDLVGPGGVVTITGTDAAGNSVNRQTTTAADGTFIFNGLLAANPSGYTVTAQPYSGDLPATATPGSAGGTAGTGNDVVSNIQLPAGVNATGYLYPQIGTVVQGVVFDDLNGNGTLDPGDNGIPGVTITLTPSGGGASLTATTDANGSYNFTGIPSGTYDITETLPPGYGSSTPTTISNVNIPSSGVTGVNFGLTTSSLAGTVFNDLNNNGVPDSGEAGIAGVTLTLTGTDAGNNSVNKTAVTDSNGSYQFVGVPAGTYTIIETQPSGYNDGKETAGTASGTTTTPNTISAINLPATTAATGYDFGELGSTIQGTVFNDDNKDGVLDNGESPMQGIVVGLYMPSNHLIASTITDSSGHYSFANLPGGNYSVFMSLPVGYGNTTPVSVPVAVTASTTPYEADFGIVRSSISGVVFFDPNNNGVQDSGDTGIGGVTLTLSGTAANNQPISLTTATASDGTYSFANLFSGTYSITETQPSGYNDGMAVPGTSGGTASSNLIGNIKLATGTSATGYNFGEIGTSIGGTVFLDQNGNGTRDSGDNGFGDTPVTLTLLNSSNQVVATTTTQPDGTYTFTNIVSGSYTVVLSTPNGYGTSTPTTIPVNLTTTNTANQNFGLTTSSLAGFAYFDANDNGTYDSADRLLKFTATLTGTDANDNPVNLNIPVAADGTFVFSGLLSGTYTVSLDPYPGLTLETATVGTTGGTAEANNDTVSGINLDPGTSGTGYQFPESGAIVSGTVFFDADHDGLFDHGETGIPNATVTLSATNNKTGAPYTLTATTDANGFYSFPTPAKTVTLTVTPPNGETADTPTTIVASVPPSGLTDQNFGFTSASLAGQVYVDNNNDGVRQSIENPIAGVTITLDGTETNGGKVIHLTTATTEDGSYRFLGLQAGTYTITETQPDGYFDGKDKLGTSGGTLGNDTFTSIPLAAGQVGTGYDFGELAPASLAGTVYSDLNNNGRLDTGEAGISGVTLTLSGTDINGQTVNLTTTTDSSGNYTFANLEPSDSTGYTITETQPAGYFDGKDLVGSQGGTLGNDVISQIVLGAGIDGTSNNFGELAPASVGGNVFVDVNDNRVDNNEPGISGVTITLKGTDDLGNPVSLTTTTANDGSYSFNNLRPSDANGYTVAEPTQPAGYLDGLSATTSHPNPNGISGVIVTAGSNARTLDFAELIPSSLSGYVYSDLANNGIRVDGDPPIAGVTIKLTGFDDQRGVVNLTTTTDANGFYSFNNLRPSLNDERAGLVNGYTITETQPANYDDGQDTIGTPGGTTGNDNFSAILLVQGFNGTNNNFGEIAQATPPPPPTPTGTGSLNGYTYFDANQNGIHDAGDTPLAGVTVTLDGTANDGTAIHRTLVTDNQGYYQFDSLPAGVYSITETVPSGYGGGQANTGTLGGTAESKTIKGITVGVGVAGDNYDFGELLTSDINGKVYLDLNRNGRLDSLEFGMAHIKITLTGTTNTGQPVSLAETTDADGHYDFANLDPGTYKLEIRRPSAYFANGKISTGSPDATVGLNTINGIILGNGATVSDNNFGELIRAGCRLSATDCRLNSAGFQKLLKLGPDLPADVTATLAGPRWTSNGPIGYYLPKLKDASSPITLATGNRIADAKAHSRAVAIANKHIHAHPVASKVKAQIHSAATAIHQRQAEAHPNTADRPLKK